MKIILALAGLLAVGLATSDEAVGKERQARQFFIHPSLHSTDYAKNPILPYLMNNNPLFRQFPGRDSSRSSSSSSASSSAGVTTVTSTAVLTCTLSTTACAARRRRHVLSDLLEQQHEEIQPSAVNKIEATASPMDDSIRERRAADPQMYLAHPSYYSQLSPSLLGNLYDRQNNPFPLPAPANSIIAALNNLFSQVAPPIVANNNPLNALAAILSGSMPTIWIPGASSSSSSSSSSSAAITSTSCVWVVSTTTSTPSCSVAGTLPQCAASSMTTSSG